MGKIEPAPTQAKRLSRRLDNLLKPEVYAALSVALVLGLLGGYAVAPRHQPAASPWDDTRPRVRVKKVATVAPAEKPAEAAVETATDREPSERAAALALQSAQVTADRDALVRQLAARIAADRREVAPPAPPPVIVSTAPPPPPAWYYADIIVESTHITTNTCCTIVTGVVYNRGAAPGPGHLLIKAYDRNDNEIATNDVYTSPTDVAIKTQAVFEKWFTGYGIAKVDVSALPK